MITDLTIYCNDENGNEVKTEYGFFDFKEDFEKGNLKDIKKTYTNVRVVMFEKEILTQRYKNIEELYNHCVEVSK